MNRAEAERSKVSEDGQSSSMEKPAQIPLSTRAQAKEESPKPPAGSTASEQKNVENPQPGADLRFQKHSQNIASESQMLRRQLKVYQQDLSHYQEIARIAQARAKDLEVHSTGLMERCEDAESTLFRLRPQRQQCTETEVKEDYESLKASIQTWVDNNCAAFLDNEQLGCAMIGGEIGSRHGQLQGHEIVLQNFGPQSSRWNDAKDQLLIAIIMRYAFDKILSRPYPLGLTAEDQALLGNIEKSMESLEPRRDLQTRRNWRSDAMAAFYNCQMYVDNQANSAKSLAKGLFIIIQRTLPMSSDRNWSYEVIDSLLSEVIKPSQALAQKIQCASSYWRFEYSPYWNIPPGHLAKRLPSFFENIMNFQCHNLSESRKTLKPASDLATGDQQNSLIYILDVYPGLYCSRVDVDKFLPVMTITQPILLVTFMDPNLLVEGTAPQPRARSEDGRQHKGSSTTKKSWGMPRFW